MPGSGQKRLIVSRARGQNLEHPEVGESGSIDEYGEWEAIEAPLDPIDLTLSSELAKAARELGLTSEDD